MNIFDLNIVPAWQWFLALILAVVAWVIWFLIRKKSTSNWLPILEIIDLPKTKYQTLKWNFPPLLPFFCSIFMSLIVLFFMLRPSLNDLEQKPTKKYRAHLFVDFSPSVSNYVDFQEYQQTIKKIADEYLKENHVLSLSSSRGKEVYSYEEWHQQVAGWGFHRYGARLSEALDEQWENIGKIDELVILSDRDLSTWLGFAWRNLESKLKFRYIDVSKASSSQNNAYIENIEDQNEPGSLYYRWKVQISSSLSKSLGKGKLVLSQAGKILEELDWNFSQNGASISVEVEASRSKVVGLKNLKWQIFADSNNATQVDDVFYSSAGGSIKNAIVISPIFGERSIHDPAYHLSRSLEVLGFKVYRYDQLPLPKSAPVRNSLIVSFGGSGDPIESFCPYGLTSGVKAFWLSPLSQNVDYSNLCHCFEAMTKNSDVSMPAYCSDVGTSAIYSNAMRSRGAKQVGGEVGQIDETLAWSQDMEANDQRFLSFSYPLAPSFDFGISHSRLPIVIKSLLVWQGILGSNDFIVKSLPKPDSYTEMSEKQMLNVASYNTPQTESNVRNLEADQLPSFSKSKSIFGGNRGANQQLSGDIEKKQKPIILFIMPFLVVVFIVEVLYFMLKLFRKDSNAIFLLLGGFFLFAGGAEHLEAKVHLHTLGYQEYSKEEMKKFVFTIKNRTSIDFVEKAQVSRSIQEMMTNDPWVFIKNSSLISDKEGALDSRVWNWLKRGGFMILVERSESKLRQLFSQQAKKIGVPSKIQPIPADHEIMRSFFLLKTLPPCGETIWKGLHFDGRLSVLVVPFDVLDFSMGNRAVFDKCGGSFDQETASRIMVNTLMVVLATDYKKDQVHIPEILKRLR